jgi:hypothetical protein
VGAYYGKSTRWIIFVNTAVAVEEYIAIINRECE